MGAANGEEFRAPLLPELSIVAQRSAEEAKAPRASARQFDDGKALHDAIRTYIEWIEQDYCDPQGITAFSQAKPPRIGNPYPTCASGIKAPTVATGTLHAGRI